MEDLYLWSIKQLLKSDEDVKVEIGKDMCRKIFDNFLHDDHIELDGIEYNVAFDEFLDAFTNEDKKHLNLNR